MKQYRFLQNSIYNLREEQLKRPPIWILLMHIRDCRIYWNYRVVEIHQIRQTIWFPIGHNIIMTNLRRRKTSYCDKLSGFRLLRKWAVQLIVNLKMYDFLKGKIGVNMANCHVRVRRVSDATCSTPLLPRRVFSLYFPKNKKIFIFWWLWIFKQECRPQMKSCTHSAIFYSLAST